MNDIEEQMFEILNRQKSRVTDIIKTDIENIRNNLKILKLKLPYKCENILNINVQEKIITSKEEIEEIRDGVLQYNDRKFLLSFIDDYLFLNVKRDILNQNIHSQRIGGLVTNKDYTDSVVSHLVLPDQTGDKIIAKSSSIQTGTKVFNTKYKQIQRNNIDEKEKFLIIDHFVFSSKLDKDYKKFIK